MRITQRVIFKLYLKYYNHPDNDIFIDNALDWKPDVFLEPWCKYYLCKYEIKVFRSHFKRNNFEKRRLWPDVQCGKELLSLKISDRELMEKLKIMETNAPFEITMARYANPENQDSKLNR